MFTKPSVLVFLTHKSLEIYSPGLKGSDRVEFPETVYSNLEIVGAEKFKEMVVEALAGTNLKKQQVLIVLSDSVLFQKEAKVNSQEDKDVLINQFENNIPFEAQKISRLQLEIDGNLRLIATNKELYEALVDAVQALEWEVVSVSPLGSFIGAQEGAVLTDEEVSAILSARDIYKKSNFLDIVKAKEPLLQEPGQKGAPKITLILLVIMILIIAGGLFLARSYLNKIRLKVTPSSSNSINLPIVSASPTPTASASATPAATEEVAASDLRVQILNGSGVTGQASKVSAILKTLGYQDIKTGNGSTKSTDTLLEVGASVSAQQKDELKTTLAKTFKNVIPSELDSKLYDLIIVTGNELP